MEGLQETKKHWQRKQRKVLYILRKIAKTLSFPPLSVMCKLFDTIVLPVLYYGAEVWGMVKSEEIEKIQFQFCKFILQVPTRAPTAAVMEGLRWFPVLLHTQLKATKYFVYPQLPNIPHSLAEAYITVTNNLLPWVRDLHSAGLPIGTTEPITSHNESLQVVKSSAIAKHLTEWSGILWKTSIAQGIQQRLHTQLSPICSSWQTVTWENHCENFGIGCHQLKIETGRYQRPVPPPTANIAQLTVWRMRSIS